MGDKTRVEGVAFEVPEGVDVPRGVPTGDQHPRVDRAQGMQVAVEGQREDQGARTSGQKMEAALYESREKQMGSSLGDTAAARGAGAAIHRQTELAESGHMPYEEQLKGGVWVNKEAASGGNDVQRVGQDQITAAEGQESGMESRELPSTPGAAQKIAESTEGSS
jgi:hypothetical protein